MTKQRQLTNRDWTVLLAAAQTVSFKKVKKEERERERREEEG
jgi:hypothetical protein